MKCPACNFVCSDLRDICPKCYCDLRPQKRLIGIPAANPNLPYHELLGKITARPKGDLPAKKSRGFLAKLTPLINRFAAKKKPPREKPIKASEPAAALKQKTPALTDAPVAETVTEVEAEIAGWSLDAEAPPPREGVTAAVQFEELPETAPAPQPAAVQPQPAVLDLSNASDELDSILDGLVGNLDLKYEAVKTPKEEALSPKDEELHECSIEFEDADELLVEPEGRNDDELDATEETELPYEAATPEDAPDLITDPSLEILEDTLTAANALTAAEGQAPSMLEPPPLMPELVEAQITAVEPTGPVGESMAAPIPEPEPEPAVLVRTFEDTQPTEKITAPLLLTPALLTPISEPTTAPSPSVEVPAQVATEEPPEYFETKATPPEQIEVMPAELVPEPQAEAPAAPPEEIIIAAPVAEIEETTLFETTHTIDLEQFAEPVAGVPQEPEIEPALESISVETPAELIPEPQAEPPIYAPIEAQAEAPAAPSEEIIVAAPVAEIEETTLFETTQMAEFGQFAEPVAEVPQEPEIEPALESISVETPAELIPEPQAEPPIYAPIEAQAEAPAAPSEEIIVAAPVEQSDQNSETESTQKDAPYEEVPNLPSQMPTLDESEAEVGAPLPETAADSVLIAPILQLTAAEQLQKPEIAVAPALPITVTGADWETAFMELRATELIQEPQAIIEPAFETVSDPAQREQIDLFFDAALEALANPELDAAFAADVTNIKEKTLASSSLERMLKRVEAAISQPLVSLVAPIGAGKKQAAAEKPAGSERPPTIPVSGLAVLAAAVLDLILGILISLGMVIVYLWMAHPFGDDQPFSAHYWIRFEDLRPLGMLLATGLVSTVLYPLISLFVAGKTLGQYQFGIQVLDLQGEEPSYEALLIRNSSAPLAFLLTLHIPFLIKGCMLHDQIAGTQLVKAPRIEPTASAEPG